MGILGVFRGGGGRVGEDRGCFFERRLVRGLGVFSVFRGVFIIDCYS